MLFRSLLWGSPAVRNVSVAELLPLLPAGGAFAETAIIICPGGAFHFLMIEKEGRAVGHWLNARGIACFVLKYRLAPTSEDDTEFKTFAEAGWPEMQAIQTYGPLAIEDGRQAVRVVRQRSEAFGFRRDRVGIVGFSAGGVIAAATAMAEDAELRPEFAGVIDGAPPQIRKVEIGRAHV